MKLSIYFLSLCCSAILLQAQPASPPAGTLTIEVGGMKSDEGQLIVRICRAQDDIFGKPFRELNCTAVKPATTVQVAELPYDSYSILVFQDLNRNGILDHNWVHFPSEPLGWSNNWHPGLATGMPTFEKTKFAFQQSGAISIVLQ